MCTKRFPSERWTWQGCCSFSAENLLTAFGRKSLRAEKEADKIKCSGTPRDFTSGNIKEGKTMDKEWEKLYEEAMSVLSPRNVSNKMWVGSVASAVLTKKGTIYKGICIDTDGSIGMCAERNALSAMLTYGESEIKKVVSVYKDGNIIPPCGICREFMMHLGGDVENIEILSNFLPIILIPARGPCCPPWSSAKRTKCWI